MKSILKSFENYIVVWFKERIEAKLHQQKPSRRVHLEEGIKQLEVYDLRKTGPKALLEDMVELFTTEFPDPLNDLTVKDVKSRVEYRLKKLRGSEE